MHKFIFFLFIALAVSVFFEQSESHADNQTQKAWFEHEWHTNTLLLSAHYLGEKNINLRYDLTTIKSGPSGRAQATQTGRFSAAPHLRQKLTSQQISISQHDTYTATLRIFKDSTLVSEVEFSWNKGAEPRRY